MKFICSILIKRCTNYCGKPCTLKIIRGIRFEWTLNLKFHTFSYGYRTLFVETLINLWGTFLITYYMHLQSEMNLMLCNASHQMYFKCSTRRQYLFFFHIFLIKSGKTIMYTFAIWTIKVNVYIIFLSDLSKFAFNF